MKVKGSNQTTRLTHLARWVFPPKQLCNVLIVDLDEKEHVGMMLMLMLISCSIISTVGCSTPFSEFGVTRKRRCTLELLPLPGGAGGAAGAAEEVGGGDLGRTPRGAKKLKHGAVGACHHEKKESSSR